MATTTIKKCAIVTMKARTNNKQIVKFVRVRKMDILLIPVVAVTVGIYTYTKAKKNRMAQAVGAAIMPGLFIGALIWCLISCNFGIIILDIAIAVILIACLYFGFIRFT